MIPRTVAELADLLDADLVGGPGVDPTGLTVDSVVVDSRAVTPGALFVALPGERVDGHDYVRGALADGAVAALTARPVEGAGPCLVVPDPQAALGRLGREQVDLGVAGGLQVVALTGSQGKTSTKDLLGQLLARLAPTVAPAGNLNNEIGLPLTLARITPETRYLVAEMGARGVGHIAYLCRLAPPQIGLVLNVGTAHVGEFGGREAIAQAKGELVEALPPDGVAVLNADDPYVRAMASRTRAAIWWTSVHGDPGGEAAAWAGDVATDEIGRPAFTLSLRTGSGPDSSERVQLAVTGRHHVANALAAAAAAAALGIASADIAAGLAAAGPRSRWRMELQERPDGVLIVNDAYNANPESMRAALDTTAELATRRGGTARALLGDMLELGSLAQAEHAQLGRYAVERGVAQLWAVGAYADAVVAGAQAVDPGISARAVEVSEAAEAVSATLRPGDVVLVKASRGLALDTVAEAIAMSESVPDAPGDGVGVSA